MSRAGSVQRARPADGHARVRIPRATAGMTFVEAVIALALVGLVVTKLTLLIDTARKAHQEESVALALGDQAMVLLDRIAYALVGAARDKLDPIESVPLFSAEIRFQVSLGVEDGEPVWSDPEIIALSEEDGQVYWGQNVGEPNERVVVWANTVSKLLEDELLNGSDDNDNGIADELGLAFVVDERSVTIRLTLERVREDGEKIQVTRETTVTCRN